MHCSRCENALSDEEAESPRRERGCRAVICDDCWHEKYEFTCCCCCNYGDVKDQHKMLVVFEPVDSICGRTREVSPGVYGIKGGPYFGGPLIGDGWLYAHQLERVADLNPDMDGDGYPCGHLCLECQQKVLAQFAGRCAVCRQQFPSCLRVRLGSWKDFKANKYQWTKPKTVCAACRHKHRGSWKVA